MAGLLASAGPLLAKRGAVLPAGQLETTRLRDANQVGPQAKARAQSSGGSRLPVVPIWSAEGQGAGERASTGAGLLMARHPASEQCGNSGRGAG